MELIKGQKIKLEQLVPSMDITLKSNINFRKDNIDLDMCCFGVDKDDKLSDDRYFIFYNQITSPDNSIKKIENKNEFEINIKLLTSTIKKIVLCVTIDGQCTMKDVQSGSLKFMDGLKEVGEFKIQGKDYSSEKSIILAEIYEKNGVWKLGVIGSGFNGDLGDILRNYGGEEIEESQKESINVEQTTQENKNNLGKNVYLEKKKRVEKLVLEKAPHLIDLTKKVTITLEKKSIEKVMARVLVVLDRSGSMWDQYSYGDVQKAMDKILPIALMFDDDGELDTWVFGNRAIHLSDISLDNISGYLNKECGGWKSWDIGCGNDEPCVMKKIVDLYSSSELPVYVIFISDGGIYKEEEIKKVIKRSSRYPIFWQFVGMGGSNYGILEELDEMDGRIVDNANFFSIDSIDSLADEVLYEKLLNEFPSWLKEASLKNIIKK